jgi:hypothetical protein
VLVMERLDGRPLATIDPGTPAGVRAALARGLLDCLLRQVMLEGTFHADPHPGNVLLLADGRLGLLDFGSVGRIDAGLGTALQRLPLALAATSGVMAVLMLGLHGGPAITKTVTLYAFFGYCLLVIAAILALRVLVLVFRPDTR